MFGGSQIVRRRDAVQPELNQPLFELRVSPALHTTPSGWRFIGTMRNRSMLVLGAAALLLIAQGAAAYNNPTLEWRTIKTPHFEVHYHQGAEWTAQMVAHVAEEVHGPLTELYQYEPPVPVHFIIKDTDDYANGATFFYDNKIELWATNLEFGFRGTSDWIRNVVTHEYTHMISIQASLKFPMRIPALYFQYIGFEDEKRSDVLNGYPDNLVSYPFSGVMMPPWFAEGTAQYQAPNKQYDCWDTHRDMVLRAAVLDDKMLTYDEMGFFGKTSLGSEQVYDHGYGLVSFIAAQYGPHALKDIAYALRNVTRLNMDGALKKVTGKTGRQLYDDWKTHLKARYDAETTDVRANPRTGTALDTDGFMTLGPAFSPDGTRIAYLSNKGSDYAGTSLYIMDRDGKNKKMLKGGVSSSPQFSPDGGRILYSRKEKVDRYGSTVNDIYVYDLSTKKETRLTHAARAADPDYSPDGRNVVYVRNADGTHHLMIMDADGGNPREIYSGEKGTQLYNPHFARDGGEILFGIFHMVARDIAVIHPDGSGFRYLLETANDERDARWAPDGSIVFASDRSGIFDIYRMNLASGWIEKMTNVFGGAFEPDLAPNDGALAYAGYTADGYGVFRLDGPSTGAETMDRVTYSMRAAGEFDECVALRTAAAERESAAGGLRAASAGGAAADPQSDAGEATPGKSKMQGDFETYPYKPEYTPFQFYPRFLIYDNTARFGLLMASYEILDKQAFTLGGSYGTNGEFDGYLGYEIRNFWPTLFANLYTVREKTSDSSVDRDSQSDTFGSSFDYNLRYDLWQAELGARLEFSEAFSLTHQHDLSAYYTHGEYSVHIDGKQFDQGGAFKVSFNGGWKYYIGNQLHLQYNYRKLSAATDTDINPRGGRAISLHYLRSFDRLFTSGQFQYGFRPVFTDNHYNQYTADWREYVALPYLRHTLRLRLYGSVIDKDVDDFFWVYMGGRDGIRGYTYYSIGGRKAVLGSVTYRFPIVRNINRQFLHLYFRDVYGSVFFESANAWNANEFKDHGYRKSAGYELRMSLGSYYVFPTAVSIVAAYSLDPVSFVDPGIGSVPITIAQARKWSYYFTVAFGFDL
jgi:hypothetical protein